MELQEAFDFVIDKLAEQKVRCVDEEGCQYENDEGHHCAIGWLLDHNDDDLMRFKGGISVLALNHPTKIPTVIADNPSAFAAIQRLHDESFCTGRNLIINSLKEKHGIDVSNPNVGVWVNLGEPDIF